MFHKKTQPEGWADTSPSEYRAFTSGFAVDRAQPCGHTVAGQPGILTPFLLRLQYNDTKFSGIIRRRGRREAPPPGQEEDCGLSGGGQSGSLIRTRAPAGGALPISKVPPCSRMKSLVIARPTPVPSGLRAAPVLRDPGTTPPGRPGPVSETSISACTPERRRTTLTFFPRGCPPRPGNS